MNTHTEEQASLYVLDKLDHEERISFEQIMEADDQVRTLVHELEDGLEAEIRKLPQYKPAPNTLELIQARIKEEEQEAEPEKIIHFPWASLNRMGIAAIILLGVGLTFLIIGKPDTTKVHVVSMGSHHSTASTLDSTQIQFESEDHFATLASLASDYWDNPELSPVSSTVNKTDDHGYAVFDAETNSGFIAIKHLPKPENGKLYRLWVSDPKTDELHNAGDIPLAGNGKGLYHFTLDGKFAPNVETVEFFVTEESIEDSEKSQPQGRRVLGNDEL